MFQVYAGGFATRILMWELRGWVVSVEGSLALVPDYFLQDAGFTSAHENLADPNNTCIPAALQEISLPFPTKFSVCTTVVLGIFGGILTLGMRK